MTWEERFKAIRRKMEPSFSLEDWNVASCWASCPVGEQLTSVISSARTHPRARALGLEFWRFVGDNNVEGAWVVLTRIKAWRRQLSAVKRKPRTVEEAEDE